MRYTKFDEQEFFSDDQYDSSELDDSPDRSGDDHLDDVLSKIYADLREYCDSRVDVPVVVEGLFDDIEDQLRSIIWLSEQD